MNWTPEQDEVIVRMWATDTPAREIADEIGAGRNKMMVIGRARRLGLAKKQPSRPGSGVPKGPRNRRKPSSRIRVGGRGWNSGVREFEAPEMPAPDIDDQAIPLDQRCTIEQLTNQTCRFPIGHPDEPSFFYCGALEANFAIGLPYCPGHHARCFNGTSPAPRPLIPMRSQKV